MDCLDGRNSHDDVVNKGGRWCEGDLCGSAIVIVITRHKRPFVLISVARVHCEEVIWGFGEQGWRRRERDGQGRCGRSRSRVSHCSHGRRCGAARRVWARDVAAELAEWRLERMHVKMRADAEGDVQ